MSLTHIGADGAARMVDVSGKAVTARTATAEGFISMKAETLAAVVAGDIKKGDVLGVARVAGIMAAKRTAELIPLCHPLPLAGVEVTVEPADGGIRVTATARTSHTTGVEMEALSAVSVALLTVYDMAKAIDRGMTISGVRLLAKSGGRSGDWRAADLLPE